MRGRASSWSRPLLRAAVPVSGAMPSAELSSSDRLYRAHQQALGKIKQRRPGSDRKGLDCSVPETMKMTHLQAKLKSKQLQVRRPRPRPRPPSREAAVGRSGDRPRAVPAVLGRRGGSSRLIFNLFA